MGFRLVYELSYLVEKKFWSIFSQQGGPLPLLLDKVYNAKNIFWIATLYRKIGRKITFDFKAPYIGPEEVFWEN